MCRRAPTTDARAAPGAPPPQRRRARGRAGANIALGNILTVLGGQAKLYAAKVETRS
jgi:hypothetical protein